MSKNYGRRIIDTARNEDLREKTRSALYDIIADFIRRAPDAASAMGYRLMPRHGVFIRGNRIVGGSLTVKEPRQ